MRRFFRAAFVVAAFTMNNDANAQEKLSISVKGIPQFSFFQNKDDNNNSHIDRKATFNASFGVGAAYNFTQKMGVGLDFLYSLQGQRYKINGYEMYQKTNYLKIPVYFAYNTDPTRRFSFIGKVGPQLSILTNSKLTDKDGKDIISNTNDRFKDLAFGAMAGAGVQYKLNKQLYLTTMARFDYDFTNVEDDSYRDYASGRADSHNMTTGMEVGLKYILP